MSANLLATNLYALYKGLSIGFIVGALICAIFVIIVVLIQPGNSNGISALGSNAETFYNKDKGKTLESKLRKLTYISIAIMAVFMIGFFIIQLDGVIL